MATMCSEMLGGCVTSEIEFSDHSWDGKNLVLVGTDDKFGPFDASGSAKDGNMIMQKTYKSGLKVEMIVDSVPSESGQFLFGNFEFETNAGQRRGFDYFLNENNTVFYALACTSTSSGNVLT